MRQQNDRKIEFQRQPTQKADEGARLKAIDFVTTENVGERIDDQKLRSRFSKNFSQAVPQRRRLQVGAGTILNCKKRIFAS